MIKVIALLLLLQNAASGEKYYLEFDNFLYPGVSNFPEFAMITVLDGYLQAYYDENVKHINEDWLKELIKENTKEWESTVQESLAYKNTLRELTKNFNTPSNQSEGKDIIQQITVCEWDEDTNYTFGHIKFVLPSVFLLQKSPSSPVTCQSTGFFPDKGIMFWRKDGEEIHEGVEHGDLLPNDDGSFQMSVYLEALKIPPEDWGRYECVFQLSGVQNYVVTKLDQDSIRSNNPKNEGLLTTTSIAVIATMGCVIVIIIVALSSTAFKKRNVTHSIERSSTPSSETASL
ncbi:major histocompatibility complex class I-related gene protein-like isoform X2 [Xiphophorus hellerii]|uniref:major histocompatibility complex class I-related gene protein-like isoform X2 n=1 Tax=Xiphophorus hellerii TaxID=8084 RepID=UPI0013B3F137|nr:major histocompatibility complex class I-related gene protein-like isoform X2 [Xiphophorus hellerii]